MTKSGLGGLRNLVASYLLEVSGEWLPPFRSQDVAPALSFLILRVRSSKSPADMPPRSGVREGGISDSPCVLNVLVPTISDMP